MSDFNQTLRRAENAIGLWGGLAATLVLTGCPKEERKPRVEPSVEVVPEGSGGAREPNPAAAIVEPNQCTMKLDQVMFRGCNEHPRFKTMPDCFEYSLAHEQGNDGCVPGRFKLTIVGPQAQVDEVVVKGAENAQGNILLTLEAVQGSMLKRFDGKPGVEMGTIVIGSGGPEALELGRGLLPSEIGVTNVPVDEDGYD